VAVHFVYYQDWSEWRQDSPLTHVVLDGSRGVALNDLSQVKPPASGIEKIERQIYRLSYGGKSVVFALALGEKKARSTVSAVRRTARSAS
jgi:hypothetical protein